MIIITNIWFILYLLHFARLSVSVTGAIIVVTTHHHIILSHLKVNLTLYSGLACLLEC